MIKNIQTKLHDPPTQMGNCFATVLSCFLDIAVEDVPPFEKEMENNPNWIILVLNYLLDRGWEWGSLDSHGKGFYLVVGNTIRSKDALHVCIYKDGKLYHDPHPDQTGLINEKHFQYLIKEE